MNSSHAAVLTGSTSGTAMLAILLTGWHGLDAEHANAAAWLISNAIGFIAAFGYWLIKLKWPSAPPPPPMELSHAVDTRRGNEPH